MCEHKTPNCPNCGKNEHLSAFTSMFLGRTSETEIKYLCYGCHSTFWCDFANPEQPVYYSSIRRLGNIMVRIRWIEPALFRSRDPRCEGCKSANVVLGRQEGMIRYYECIDCGYMFEYDIMNYIG